MPVVAATVLGTGLVVLVAVDLFLTIFHPTRDGPVSRVVLAAVWRAARGLSSVLHRDAPLGGAGPLMVLAQLLAWVLGLWVGFALVYVGRLDQVAYPAGAPAPGPLDAFYLSGSALTTVGFGDLVPTSRLLRLVAVAEGAAGLAVFGTAIAYLLAVYPLVSEIRVAARQVALAQDDRGAAELVVHGGLSRVAALQRDLVQLDESTQRFPVLYYFHTSDGLSSLATVVRAASLVVLQLRFGVSLAAVPQARWQGRVLEATLLRVLEHVAARFHSGTSDPGALPVAVPPDRRLQALRDAAAAVSGTRAEDEPDRAALTQLLARSNAFLAQLERRHGYRHAPV